ncbi:hypothetical protein SAMN04487995_6188 [Dyadobacter koreensis]|uniref:Uncharacterized protein n=1 Tax=Dyadobacter koreensis TaxID=408657 RepID=A0A1H7BH80_9BACT|nr:hypothetical protein [Dyadobacter koreensis]SEJ73580.1 hypothetical protein SAMN04487995_6188 [Dyadobacter koreensis]
MSVLFAIFLLLAQPEIINPVSDQDGKFSNDIEFLDDFQLRVYGGSFFTFDTTSVLKQKFIFVVSATRIAYFKKGGRLLIVNYLKREIRQNGYIDFFEGSGYKIRLNVVKANKIGKSRTGYIGVLEFAHNQITTTVRILTSPRQTRQFKTRDFRWQIQIKNVICYYEKIEIYRSPDRLCTQTI